MKKLTNDKAWALIAEMGWGGRTVDYKHLAETYHNLLGKDGLMQLQKFVGARVSDLGDAVKKYEANDNDLEIGSDDGFSDLRYHIVGLGKDEFERCMVNPSLMETRYAKGDYKESFAYCFHEPWPERTMAQKQASRKLLVKRIGQIEQNMRELEFQMGTLRGEFSDVNLLLGQVMEDTKSGN